MGVSGIGVDLADLRRIRGILEGPLGERFASRICTERERELCARRRDPAECLGARFAAKEAFAKAIGAPGGLGWHEVEVVREGGAPTLEVKGRAAEVLEERGVTRIHLSLSHDGDMAVAMVVLEE